MVMIMENVKISKVCGICAGCNYAIQTAQQKIDEGKQVVLFKEIVHNPHVNNNFANKGVCIANNLSDLKANNHVIIRAHGEPPETYEYLTNNNISFSDCTCVNVKNIHKKVNSFSKSGYTIIIIGKYGKANGKPHPETVGTIGWCKNEPILIEDMDDLYKLNFNQPAKYYLVCQTTFNEQKADEIIEHATKLCNANNRELIINKSICSAQKNINRFSVELAKSCDIMVVVGGKKSSNSLELFNNVKNYTNAIFIEEINDWYDEIKNKSFEFNATTKVGLTAGASTPKDELFELKKLIENKQKELSL